MTYATSCKHPLTIGLIHNEVQHIYVKSRSAVCFQAKTKTLVGVYILTEEMNNRWIEMEEIRPIHKLVILTTFTLLLK